MDEYEAIGGSQSTHSSSPRLVSADGREQTKAFRPQQGVDSVVVRPGPVSALAAQIEPSSPKSLFLYSLELDKDFAKMGQPLDAVVFGAKLSSSASSQEGAVPLADVTGQADDVLQGKLLSGSTKTWSQQLRAADKRMGYTHNDSSCQVVRAQVEVVLADGSSRPALAYFRKPNAQEKASGDKKAAAKEGRPELIVFDLDNCMWLPETYLLDAMPSKPVKGDLNGRGQGVVGVQAGPDTMQLFPGALAALQEIADGKFPGSRLAFASSADTPFAARCAHKALTILEVLPGLTIAQLAARGFPKGFTGNLQIGRHGPVLSSDKTTHFRQIKAETGVEWSEMIFYDDASWNCRRVADGCGVLTVHTPHGMTLKLFHQGLTQFARQKQTR